MVGLTKCESLCSTPQAMLHHNKDVRPKYMLTPGEARVSQDQTHVLLVRNTVYNYIRPMSNKKVLTI